MADINVEIDLKGFEELKNLGKMVQQLRQNLNAQTTSIKQGFEELWKKLEGVSAKGGRNAGSKASGAFLSELRKIQYGARSILTSLGVGSLGSGNFSNAGLTLGSLLGPEGAVAGAIIGGIGDIFAGIARFVYTRVKDIFDAARDVEDTRVAYALHGGISAGARQYSDVINAPFNLKFTPNQLAQALIPALSAGFSDNQLKNVANSSLIAAKATRGAGYSLSDVSEYAERFAAVKLREGLSRRQLVGFGIVNADEFFTNLAKSMQDAGVATKLTAKDAETFAKDGKHADFVLKQLHLSIRAMADSITGGDRSGLHVIETLGDVWERVTTIPRRIYESIINDTNAFSVLKRSLNRFYSNFFNGEGGLTKNGQDILDALSEGVARIVDLFNTSLLTPQNIRLFTTGLINIITWLNWFVTKAAEWTPKALRLDYRILDFFLGTDYSKDTSSSFAPPAGTQPGNIGGLISSIPDLSSQFRRGHTGNNALPWSPQALPNDNLGVTNRPPFVDTLVHNPQYHMTFNGSVEPDRVRDAVIEGNRQAIKEFEAAVQQNGGF